jgi:hypothetical protein
VITKTGFGKTDRVTDFNDPRLRTSASSAFGVGSYIALAGL